MLREKLKLLILFIPIWVIFGFAAVTELGTGNIKYALILAVFALTISFLLLRYYLRLEPEQIVAEKKTRHEMWLLMAILLIIAVSASLLASMTGLLSENELYEIYFPYILQPIIYILFGLFVFRVWRRSIQTNREIKDRKTRDGDA